jgi:hypothetical protein
VPTLQSDSETGTNGAVAESGNLLGVTYMGSQDQTGNAGLTILDEGGALVGTPMPFGPEDSSLAWSGIAGTAQGFVCFFDKTGQQATQAFFVATSATGAVAGAGGAGGAPAFPGFTLPGKAGDIRAVSDNIGSAARGGVGVALAFDTGTVGFAYVNADGVGHTGPYQALARGAAHSTVSLTTFNGMFVITAYTGAMHSAQIVASGICP